MHNVIYKVTSKQVIKMIKEEDFLDLKTHILDLSNHSVIPVWKMNDLFDTPDGICIFTHSEEIAEVYKQGLATYEKNGGV